MANTELEHNIASPVSNAGSEGGLTSNFTRHRSKLEQDEYDRLRNISRRANTEDESSSSESANSLSDFIISSSDEDEVEATDSEEEAKRGRGKRVKSVPQKYR